MSEIDYLIIINNKSGKGKAETIFKKFLKNKLKKSKLLKISYFGYFEKYLLDNKKIFENLKFIIILGGDGTIHTVCNNLLNNNLDIPIAIIPVGSGNGLFKSITYEKNKEYSIQKSLNIIDDFNKSNLLNSDVIEINNNNNKLFSFLAITWGLISDIDINTECMRLLGSFRFDLGAIWYLLRKKFYEGKLVYLDDNNNNVEIKGNFIHFWACNSSWASENTCSSKMSNLEDGYIYISYIMAPIKRCELFKILLSMNSGNFINNKNVNYIKTKQFNLYTKNGKIVIDGELKHIRNINCSLKKGLIKYLC